MSVGSRARRLSPARDLHRPRTRNFEDLTCVGGLGTFIPIRLACRLRCRLSRATASCDLRGPAPPTSRWGALPASSCSPGVVQRSPLHRFPCRSPRSWRRNCACAPIRCLRGGVASALARRPPWVPTSSFGYDLAGFFLLLVAGVLHPAPILGFGSFHPASALASAALPAPLSRPSKLCSPREAARHAHACPAAARQAPAVASVRFTEPLAASSFAVAGGDLAALLLPRSCTFRSAFPRAGPPLLPWA